MWVRPLLFAFFLGFCVAGCGGSRAVQPRVLLEAAERGEPLSPEESPHNASCNMADTAGGVDVNCSAGVHGASHLVLPRITFAYALLNVSFTNLHVPDVYRVAVVAGVSLVIAFFCVLFACQAYIAPCMRGTSHATPDENEPVKPWKRRTTMDFKCQAHNTREKKEAAAKRKHEWEIQHDASSWPSDRDSSSPPPELVLQSSAMERSDPADTRDVIATQEVCVHEASQEFSLPSQDGKHRLFQWMSQEDAAALGLPQAAAPEDDEEAAVDSDSVFVTGVTPDGSMFGGPSGLVEPIPAPWSPETVRETLLQNHIEIKNWSADTLERLTHEIVTGQSFLVVTSGGQLRRTTELVLLFIINPSTGCVLIEEEDTSRSSTRVKTSEVAPTMQRNPGESVVQAAQRAVLEKLTALPGSIHLRHDSVKFIDSEETSEEYPGLTTVVRKRLVQGQVVPKDLLSVVNALNVDDHFKDKQGLWHSVKRAVTSKSMMPEAKDGKFHDDVGFKTSFLRRVHHWAWVPLEHVQEFSKHRKWLTPVLPEQVRKAGQSVNLKSMARAKTMKRRSWNVEYDSCEVVMPWSTQEVQQLLAQHESSASAFGMSLEELSKRASNNSLYFGRRASDGQLIGIEDMVLVRVVSPSGQAVLVQKGNDRSDGYLEWPQAKRHLYETAWETARRVASDQFNLPDPDALFINFVPHELPCEGEQGVLSRRWVVTARIYPSMVKMCQSLHPTGFDTNVDAS